jgi:DNA-directed RNA polymerase specialized sigma24 family protein
LSSADADDLAQDLWEWLIRTDVSMSVIATPWLRRVVDNYILRVRRRNHRRRWREGVSLEAAPEAMAWQPEALLDSSELLDRVGARLPARERDLLELIRRGASMAEASRLLGIPHGSRAYHRRQIVAYARWELRRTNLAGASVSRA